MLFHQPIFGSTFFHDTCKFFKKCTSSIFKSTLLTYNREGLALIS